MKSKWLIINLIVTMDSIIGAYCINSGLTRLKSVVSAAEKSALQIIFSLQTL